MNAQPLASVESASPEDWACWELVLGFGPDLLPVVWNPKAVPTPGSKIPAFGKVPSEYAPDGRAHGIKNWKTRIITPADLERWNKDGRLSMGVRTSAVRAVDVDVTDPALAERVAVFIAERIVLPKRMRANAPKFLQPFLYPGPLKKRRIETAGGPIELLADGQQFICAGLHPSGARYEWVGGTPSNIPTLSADALETLWAGLAAEFGVKPEVPASVDERAGAALVEISADQLADLQSALAHPALLEAAGANDTWSEIGYALLSLGDPGRALWLAFSARAANPNPGAQTAEGWWQAHAMATPHSDFRHIFTLAQNLGWQNPRAGSDVSEDEFSAVTDEAPTAEPNRFTPIPAHEFVKGAALEYRVDGVFPCTGLASVYGPSGSGKSFWMLDIVSAIARGEPWRGREVKQARVCYIVAEGGVGFRKRLRAYAQYHCVGLEVMPLSIISATPNLLEETDVKSLIAAIRASGGADVVVVDTLAAASPGGNENSSEDAGRVIFHCKALQDATGGLVIVVAHTGKDETRGQRGWSGTKAAVDVEIEIKGEDEHRSARISKAKDFEGNATFPFRLVPVQLDDDEGSTSCAIAHTDTPLGSSRERAGPRGVNQKLALSVMRELSPTAPSSGVSVAEVVNAMVQQMPHDPNRRDQRRKSAICAIAALDSHGYAALRDNRIYLPDELLDFPTDASDEPATKEAIPASLALVNPKPRCTRKKDTTSAVTNGAEQLTLAEPPAQHKAQQIYVLAAVESREHQAAKHVEKLRKLGHDSARRVEDRVLVGPCRHKSAANALRDLLAANGFSGAQVTMEALR